MDEHVKASVRLDHPFHACPDLPLDLVFASRSEATDWPRCKQRRADARQALQSLSDGCSEFDRLLVSRM